MDKEKSIVLIAIVIAVVIGISLQFSQSQKQSTDVSAEENNIFNSGGISSGVSPAQESNSSPSSNHPNPTATTSIKNVTQELGLTIISPANHSTVSTSTITVSGKTSPNAEIFINDKTLKADNEGKFSASLTLDEGENIIGVAANDTNGVFVEKEIIITYQP